MEQWMLDIANCWNDIVSVLDTKTVRLLTYHKNSNDFSSVIHLILFNWMHLGFFFPLRPPNL
jgi:hypothetical protein